MSDKDGNGDNGGDDTEDFRSVPNPIERLTRDLATAAKVLSDTEARFLVDAYYMMQRNRIRADSQIRSMDKETPDHPKEPHMLLDWFAAQSDTLESQIQRALDKYSLSHTMGEWMRGVYGIGPVISAGLLAHIDIKVCPTAGHIWRFAGLDPTVRWDKKKKRPWNASLKTLCWKLGESFVKFSNHEDCRYGHLYKARKEIEISKNEEGLFAAQAAAMLERKSFRKETEAYKHYIQGRLPPAHVHARARRWAVKIFLSHLHMEWYRLEFGKPAPAPYPIAILGHAHEHLIEP